MDRTARWFIVGGGLAIIISVIAMLVMIARVALPLFFSPSAQVIASLKLPGALSADKTAAVGSDEYHETAYVIDQQGEVSFYDLRQGQLLQKVQIAAPLAGARILKAEISGKLIHSLLWSDGSLSVVQVIFQSQFDAQGNRTIGAKVKPAATFASLGGAVPQIALAKTSGEEGVTCARLLKDGRLILSKVVVEEDIFGEQETSEKSMEITEELPGNISALTFDQAGRFLYVGTASGSLLRWDLGNFDKAKLLDRIKVYPNGSAITALNLVFGDISVAVGSANGELSTWFDVPSPGIQSGRRHLERIHPLHGHPDAVAQIIPSLRDKSLWSMDTRRTRLHLDHMTSERHLLELQTPSPVVQLGLNTRANGLSALCEDGQLYLWGIHNPHPEISWKTLLGKVWYENYPAPAYVWQSSSASDDFEPKLSLVPLIYGTFKGTLYAMLFAFPLAILGALYTSQFMRPQLRRWIKPSVEIMAAIPSVVIGFLAALWLAPRIEEHVVLVFLWIIVVPGILLLSLLAWQRADQIALVRRLSQGYEFFLLLPVVGLGHWVVTLLAPWVETHFFGGSFVQWLYQDLGLRYDQRNCVIISFALGFAVIPIIFTIADDALSNVPRSLTAASLALGASRWQTAWRVVLPSASPGIFAATMIGLGRAIGETMIVLMATGNTPILDMSPFNGMRTLSANIAVEIPEAPVDGTLYRVLFLTAVLLFMMTFVLNTAAEIVRQRLRKKYGSLV